MDYNTTYQQTNFQEKYALKNSSYNLKQYELLDYQSSIPKSGHLGNYGTD